jgi:hypothetical protein
LRNSLVRNELRGQCRFNFAEIQKQIMRTAHIVRGTFPAISFFIGMSLLFDAFSCSLRGASSGAPRGCWCLLSYVFHIYNDSLRLLQAAIAASLLVLSVTTWAIAIIKRNRSMVSRDTDVKRVTPNVINVKRDHRFE